MERSHLLTLLLTSTILLLSTHSLATNTSRSVVNPILSGNSCPVVVEIKESNGMALIPLQDSRHFPFRPNQAMMKMMIKEDSTYYEATVDGTLIILDKCDERGCTLVDEGGTKDKDLLMVNGWNTITVKHVDGEISVDVNMKENVIGRGMMKMNTNHSSSTEVLVAFLTPSPTSQDTLPYRAILNVACQDGELPNIVVEAPPAPVFVPSTRTAFGSPMDIAPVPKCPVYSVEVNHGMVPAVFVGDITLWVFPANPSLHIKVSNTRIHLNFYINGRTVRIVTCSVTERGCTTISNDELHDQIITLGQWNKVYLKQYGNKISLVINNGVIALSPDMSDTKDLQVSVLLVSPSNTKTKTSTQSKLLVNVECEGTDHQHTINQDAMTTPSSSNTSLPTKDYIVEVTTPTPSSGVSRDVGIAVGVLVGVLLVVALALTISIIKKRRSAPANEHSRLQNEQQQS